MNLWFYKSRIDTVREKMRKYIERFKIEMIS